MTVKDAAMQLVRENLIVPDPFKYCYSKGSGAILWTENDDRRLVVDLFFHSENVVLDVMGHKGWDRCHYADPAFPDPVLRTIYLAYRWLLDNRRFAATVELPQGLEQRVDMLLREAQGSDLALDHGGAGVLVVGSD